jgi:predicted aspartyl protease
MTDRQHPLRTRSGCPGVARLLLLLVFSIHGFPADSPNKAGLDEFLKKLRFGAVALQQRTSRTLSVPANLSNGQKALMLVDTGWGWSSLQEGKAKGLKTLTELGVKLQDRVFGDWTNAETVLVEKLTLGTMDFANQPTRVEKITMKGQSFVYDGALGWDFYKRNHAIIDCGAQVLYLRGEALQDPHAEVLAESLKKSGFQKVPCGLVGLTSVEASVESRKISMLVDTGCESTQIHEWVAKELGLKPVKYSEARTGSMIREEIETESVGVGDIGIHRTWYAYAPAFQLGPRSLGKTPVAVTNLKAWGVENSLDHTNEFQGLLGIDILSKQGALIDFDRQCLWLRPDNSAKPAAKGTTKN